MSYTTESASCFAWTKTTRFNINATRATVQHLIRFSIYKFDRNIYVFVDSKHKVDSKMEIRIDSKKQIRIDSKIQIRIDSKIQIRIDSKM